MAPVTPDTPSRTLSGNIARLDLDNLERHGCYSRLFYEDRVLTNVEELAQAGRLAQVLRDHGTGTRDRVLVLLPNSPELTAAFQAVWMLGAVMAPIMPVWGDDDILAVLANAEPACVITLPQVAPRIAGAIKALHLPARLLVWGETEVAEAMNLTPMVAAASPITAPVDRAEADLALLLYTSGTTAAPRGAMITHGNLRAAFENMSRLNADFIPGPMLHVLPLSHSFGLLMLNLANGWGCGSVLLPRFDPTLVFAAIERHRIEYMPVVPTMLVYLLNHPEPKRCDLSSLRRVISGGAALPEQVRASFEKVCGCRVEQGYGLSETVAVVTAYGVNDQYRTASAGRRAPGVEIEILDNDDKVAPTGAAGEICVSGRHVAAGYWRDEASTSQVFADGRLRTGDIGYLDDEGFLYITDRKKDLIIKGGENISPREIEESLHTHPSVAAAAVVGIPDSVFGENICAILQLKPGAEASAEDIRGFVTRHLGTFREPAQVMFWPELPRNFTGKIAKRTIRERLGAAQAASA